MESKHDKYPKFRYKNQMIIIIGTKGAEAFNKALGIKELKEYKMEFLCPTHGEPENNCSKCKENARGVL